MAVSFTITRNTTRFHDSNGNGVQDPGERDFTDSNGNGLQDAGELDFDSNEIGVYDPGDVLYTRITITNTGDQDATGVTVADDFSGSTFVDAAGGNPGTPFINISPIARNDTFEAVGNTVLRVGTANSINSGESTFFAGNLTTNDIGSLPADSIPNFQIDAVSGGVSVNGGKFNIFADGTFNYVNDGNDTTLTTDSFSYTIRDKGFDGVYNTGDDLTSTAKVTITFAEQSPGVAHRVWYVDSNAAAGGDGTSANPFQTMAPINGAANNGAVTGDLDKAGEYIYVENGAGAPVTGPITLENNQQLIGDGASLIVAGHTLATAGSNSTISSNATNGYVVTVGANNTIAGLNIVGNGANTGGIGDNQAGSFGTLTINPAALNSGTPGYQSTITATGAALNLSDGAIAGNGFSSTTSIGGAGTVNNVSLANITGTLNLGAGTMNGASGASFNVSGGSVSATYSGTLDHSAATGSLLSVTGGHDNGTITLNGTNTSSDGGGLVFNNADGIYTVAGTTNINGGTSGIAITAGSDGNFTFSGVNIGQTTSVNGVSVTIADSTAIVNFDADVKQTTNHAILDVSNHSVGQVTFQTTASLNATNGAGMQFSNADSNYQMNSVNTLNGGDAGIDIDTGSGGTFSFNPQTVITNPTGDAFVVDSSTASITFGGSITGNSGRVVSINKHDTTNNITFTTTSSITATAGSSGILIQNSNTGGTIAFNGQVELTTTAQNAVTLTGNTSKTINFNSDNNGLDIVTTTGGGFVASGGGTINIGDLGTGNTITSVGGVAFSATGTAIGATGITFDSISANGATNGIVLNGTGATGFFRVLGDSGSANNFSGGTIQNTTGDGIKLTGATNVSFDQMEIKNTGISGIDGTDVTNFTLTNSTISNSGLNGLTANASNVAFNDVSSGVNNLDGTVTITGNTLTNAWNSGVQIYNESGTISNLNISNNTMTASGIVATSKGSGIQVDINGSAGTAAAVSAATINDNDIDDFVSGAGIQFQGGNGALGPAVTMGTYQTTPNTGAIIQIANNDIGLNSTGTPMGTNGIAFGTTGTGQGNFAVTGNDVYHFLGIGIAGFGGNKANVSMFVDDNTVDGTDNIALSSGIAIGSQLGGADSTHNGTVRATISNNTVTGMEGVGILAGITNSYNTGYFKIVNNTVGAPQGAGNRSGIRVESGSSVGDATVFLEIANNTSGAVGLNPGISLRKQGNVAGTNEFNIEGLAPSPANHAQAEAHVSALNPNSVQTTGNGGQPSRALSVSGENYLNGSVNFLMAAAPPTTSVVVDQDAPVAPPADAGESVHTPEPDDNAPAPAPTPAPTPAATPAAPVVVVDDGVLSQAELDLLVDAAIARWAAAGASDAQIAAMRSVSISVADLSGLTLGQSNAGTIVLDSDAAGWRWFVDSTPGDDSEYAGSGTRLAAANPDGMAGTRIDLLTVLTHELGHQIGLSDLSAPGSKDELMYGTIGAGERRLPGSDDLVHAGAEPVTGAFAFAPITIGTIPAGQKVILEFRHVINTPPSNGPAGSWSGRTTVTSNEIAMQQSALESGAIDGLTLGNMVFLDVNRDGNYDAGTDSGLVGVAVDLYADTNGDNVWDPGDAFVGTTTTLAGGLYSFTALAPGNYIVVVKSTNFGSGGALEDLLITPGSVVDPDTGNTDGDNNGAAAAGGAVAAQAITLSYDNEGPSFTPGAGVVGEDTNNTVDFGFVENSPPVAVDDPGLTATEDQASQYSTQLTGNDTDVDNDTLTVVSAGNATNGSVSVSSGVVTFTPTANFNGVATFEYTISDGHGNTDVGLATVTVGAINDAPVNGVPLTTQAFNEDGTLTFNAANSNLVSVTDVDSGASDVQTTLSIQTGSLTLNAAAIGALTSVTGDGTNNVVLTGTVAEINAALDGLVYNPGANYNGDRTLTVTTNDLGNSGTDPGATGTASSEQDQDSIAIDVNGVNDAPVVIGDGTVEATTIVEDTPGPGETVHSLFNPQYSDAADAQVSAGNPGGSSPGAFCGIAVVANGSSALTGQWQYYNSSTSAWVDIGARSTSSALLIANTTLIRFNPALDFTGAAPTLTGHLIDNSLGYGITFGQVVDISGAGATGGSTSYSTGTVVLSQTVTAANVAPALDLDGDASNSAGTGFSSSYNEGGAAAAVGDTDVTITDGDSGDDIVSATITITNPETGDTLHVGSLPPTVTVESNTGTMVKLVAAAGTPAGDFEAAIKAITFSNTGDDPTDKGTNLSRSISVVVNDGNADSNVATATVAVNDVNDAPTGTSSTIAAIEDTHRALSAGDFGIVDADGTFGSVTISAVSGGGIYFDADGAGNASTPQLSTLPATYSLQDLDLGKVSFKANPNVNGSGSATITFTVADNDGASAASSNVLTVDVSAVNDAPVLTTDSPIAATEQTAVAILPAGAVADVDLDALNNGNGNYAGAQFSVNRDTAPSTDDIFTLVPGPNFTVDGTNLKTTGGQIFATISANNAGLIVINFTSSQAIATSALVDEVIQSVRYTNISDNPPASVDLAVGVTDGAQGGGQGTFAPGSHLDVNVVTVDIAGVNDAPVNSLGATIVVNEDAVDAWLSGMSISDPDIDPATEGMLVKFEVANGTLEIRTDVVGGIVAGDITHTDVGTITVVATLNKINATLAEANGLTYTPNADFNGDDTLTVTSNDRGFDGTDPGLSGDDISEEDVDTRTISVSPADDAAVARDDDVSTAENAVKTGDLFANNGSGADSDVDGDQFSVTEITVGAQTYAPGTVIDLPSGAKLTVNANGTYSYNPNGAFNRLTDSASGAVNTSADDTFSYTITGGDTATVTMTVQGVASADDWLMGDSGDNTIVGTPQPDFFFVSQGGDDNVSGLGSNDGFYFGGALTVDDVVDGGAGLDELALQGEYTGANALTMGDITDVEVMVLLPGNDARFGDTANANYSYDITTSNQNVTAGGTLYVDANRLRVGENFTFNGSAETDGYFYFYGGRGVDTITGGSLADVFLFRGSGKFTAGDTLDGGGGVDELTLRGDHSGANKVVFGANTITDIDAIVVVSGHDLRFGPDIGDLNYDLTLHDDNVAAGQLVIVDAGTLRSGESLMFDGSSESDGGKFKIFGGQGDDVLRGGKGDDIIRGGLGQDTQTGGGGNDRFVYRSASDSTTDKREGIGDFSVGDIIDLSAIDAKTGVPGNDAFSFIGSGNFTFKAGEVRAFQSAGNIWEVQADINGDGAADLDFFVTTDHDLVVTDFIL